MKDWWSPSELAGLPGMPGTERGVRDRAEREQWCRQKRAARGGGWEYSRLVLPAVTKDALARLQEPTAGTAVAPRAPKAALPAPRPAIVPLYQRTVPALATPTRPERSISQLKEWQRRVMDARLTLLREVERREAEVGTVRAVEEFVALAAAGDLPEYLLERVAEANHRKGKARVLRPPTLHLWRRAFREGGAVALAPRDVARPEVVPSWGKALLAAYRKPQKPTLTEAVREVCAAGEDVSYTKARRFLATLGNVEVQKGRLGSKELKSLKGFRRRDTKNLGPNDIWIGDGHTFDAEVCHPVHGQPFRPEVTTWLDVATRMPVGWSCGLAESALAVLDALSRGIERMGVPAILYMDRGKGYKNELLTSAGTGITSRLDITVMHSLPYNSQARGLIERFHGSVYVPAAKRLPTYIGRPMDPEAKKLAFKATRKALVPGKTAHALPVLLPWADFVSYIDAELEAYSRRPHRGLPRVRDQVTGNLRHLSPVEMLSQAVAKGWEPTPPVPQVDLYLPQTRCKVKRCEVVLFRNRYYAPELTPWDGQVLLVSYDVHDPSRVWVRDPDQRLLCQAKLEANHGDYAPLSVVERAQAKRTAGRLKRLRRQVEEVELEQGGPEPRLVEVTEEDWAAVERLEAAAAERERLVEEEEAEGYAQTLARLEAPEPDLRNVPLLPEERYEWLRSLRGRGEPLTPEQAAWLEDYEDEAMSPRRMAW